MMNVLITGGTGFIGSRLALRCLERGDKVTVFSQVNHPCEEKNRKLLEGKGADIVIGSLTDKIELQKVCNKQDLVFHLAAAQHEVNIPDQVFRDVNVEGTTLLLEAAEMAGVKRFVHGSTIGVFGDRQGKIHEDAPMST